LHDIRKSQNHLLGGIRTLLSKDMVEGLNSDRWRPWVPVAIRMIIGVGFMVHGWAKWSRGNCKARAWRRTFLYNTSHGFHGKWWKLPIEKIFR
jgi:hypothetical protein